MRCLLVSCVYALNIYLYIYIFIFIFIFIYIYIFTYIYNIYIYIYIYIYISLHNLKNLKNTFGGVILLNGCTQTLPYGCFSRYFSFVIDKAKPTCLFFILYELFQIAQSIIRQIIGQLWPLSWFPVRFCFLQRNYSYETKISIHFIDICSNPCSAYFLNSIQVSFHVVV